MSEALFYYCKLQYIRFSRKCEELQVLPFLVVVIAAVIFTGLSSFLFYKTALAKWIYPGIAAVLIVQFNNGKTSETLRSIFNHSDFRKIRLIHGTLIGLPFLLFLLYKQLWIQAVAVFGAILLLSLLTIKAGGNFRIPTPFRKWPFEFIVGFRKSIFLIIVLYLLIFKGIQVGNANLGYACMGFLFLLSMSFYAIPEHEIFVWINNKSPMLFLKKKLSIALLCSSMISLPALIALLIAFPDYCLAALFIFLAGYIFLSTMVLAKYAAFPKEMNIPQVIIIAVSFIFPPLLIYTIPSFYRKACRQIQPLLEC